MRAPRPRFLLLTFPLSLAAAAPAQAQSGAEGMAESFRRFIESIPTPRLEALARPGTMAMEGEGSVRVRPDTATIRVGVASEGVSAAEVAQDNARRMGAVLDAVKAAAGEAALASRAVELRTEMVTVTPLYAMEPPSGARRPAIRGYRAQNGVAVTVREFDKREPGFLGTLIEAATKAGANEVFGPEFIVRDDAKPLVEARVAAIDNARVKAETYAKALNVRLGRVLSVTEGERAVRPMAMAARAAGPAEAAPPIEAGTNEVAARVTVLWEIRQE